MPEYLAPGVYVEEVDRGAKSVEGVSTSTAGFLGPTERGPTDPRLLTSFSDFRRVFGGHLEDAYLPAAVEGFFANGGGRCFVGRVTGADDVAEATLPSNHNNSNGNGGGSNNDSEGGNSTNNGTDAGNGDEENEEDSENEPRTDGSGDVISVSAVGPGAWGSRVALSVEDASMQESDPDLFKLVVRYWTDEADANAVRDAYNEVDDENDLEDIDIPDPDVEEVYDDLSPEGSSSNYYVQQVNDQSALVDVGEAGGMRPANNRTDPVWLNDIGADQDDPDFEGEDDGTGFAAFEKIDGISIVCVPDEHEYDVTDPLITHCENMGDRFAILQSEESAGAIADIRPPTDTDMAAFYYPWVEVRNPVTDLVEPIPPGGHVAGIYARSDAEHGVHKAPANEVVHGIQGLKETVSKGDQEVLNPRGVNCIRSFRGRGIRVWGARTASSDPQWKYVNVRRLFLFLEESIDEGTQWVVFEPNDEQLWARVEQTIRNFLTNVWEDGALMGTSPDEAFFVKCDRSTMTQNDIDNGRLICEIGVAPVKPAEFVVFRIAQWTGDAE